MTADDGIEVSICVDCLVYEANGETPVDLDEAQTAEWLSRFHTGVGADHWLALGDSEGSFSWYPCHICRSPLGGDRYDATLFPKRVGV